MIFQFKTQIPICLFIYLYILSIILQPETHPFTYLSINHIYNLPTENASIYLSMYLSTLSPNKNTSIHPSILSIIYPNAEYNPPNAHYSNRHSIACLVQVTLKVYESRKLRQVRSRQVTCVCSLLQRQ